MATSTVRFTTSRGAVVHLESAGEGPAVLALHGVGGGAYFFRGLAERLGLGYRIVALDLPGTGNSTTPQPLLFEHWVEDITEILTRHLAEPVVIIGHSLGTMLALEVWRARSELVRGILFVGGLPEVRPVVRERLRDRIAAIAAHGMSGWGAKISPGIFGSRAWLERPEVVGLFERLIEAQDPAAYGRTLELLISANTTEIVPTVTVPCASIGGTDDQYAPPDSIAEFLRLFPHDVPSTVLPGVGHMPFFEVPDEFAALVGAFLRTVPGWTKN